MAPAEGFGRWLIAEIQRRGTTQANLARGLGVQPPTIVDYVRGTKCPSPRTRARWGVLWSMTPVEYAEAFRSMLPQVAGLSPELLMELDAQHR